ncbi:unnamed protein product [Somion occarium]|uniref:Uncharacterized protein n=1 Tax=Somion occarium TaxID=3059160 RepID=A0ABP1DNC0_9APHY
MSDQPPSLATTPSVWDEQPVIPPDPSPQLRTVLSFIQGLQESNFPLVKTMMTEDFTMSILPQSLGIPIRPRDEWLETCERASLLWPKSFRLDILDINESPGKLWLHGIATARAKMGKAYENEYMIMFRLTDGKETDGESKISEMKEFMDSLYTSNFAAEVGKSLSQIK